MATVVLCLPLLGGCSMFRNLGTGSHMDAPAPHPGGDHKKREIVVDVTTNGVGEVSEIHIQKGSGSDGVDAYVAQTIHDSWPRRPSTHTVASIIYADGGFSPPKILSTTPVPVGPTQ